MNFYGAEGTTGKTVATINTKACYTQGLGLLGLGNRDEARKCFAKSVELKPDNLLGVGDAPGVETINSCKNESSTNTDARRFRGRLP